MENTGEKTLPVIDLSLAKGPKREVVVRELHEALTTVGFVYLKGVDGFDEEELLRLTKWFFSLPLEKRMAISKKRYNSDCKNQFRGFFPVIPGDPTHREGFEFGPKNLAADKHDSLAAKIMHENNQWPEEDTDMSKHFRTWMENYHEKMTEASLELLRLIAEGFDGPSEFYTQFFAPTHLNNLRLLHYPARPNPPENARDGEWAIQVPEHQDYAMITLLANFSEYPGLQIRWWKDDSILDVAHRPGHLLMNIGTLLADTTGGILKATRHRVIDQCGDRFSVPFFATPKYDANVHVVLPGLGIEEKDERNCGSWWLGGLIQRSEFKHLEKVYQEMNGKM